MLRGLLVRVTSRGRFTGYFKFLLLGLQSLQGFRAFDYGPEVLGLFIRPRI